MDDIVQTNEGSNSRKLSKAQTSGLPLPSEDLGSGRKAIPCKPWPAFPRDSVAASFLTTRRAPGCSSSWLRHVAPSRWASVGSTVCDARVLARSLVSQATT